MSLLIVSLYPYLSRVDKYSPATPSPLNPRSSYWLYIALLDSVVAKPVPGWKLGKPVRPKSSLSTPFAQRKKSSVERTDRSMWDKLYSQKQLSTYDMVV